MFARESRLFEIAGTVCNVDDGMSIDGDGSVSVDARAAGGGGGDVESFIGVNDAPGSDALPSGDVSDGAGNEATLYAGGNGAVIDPNEEPAAQDQAQPEQPAAPHDPAAPAADPQMSPEQAVLQNPVVRAIVEPMQQQNALLTQSLQYTQSMLQSMQQQNDQFRQQVLGMAQAQQQRAVDAQRAARAPQPPPEGAGPEEHLRYENQKIRWDYDEKMQGLEARLNASERAAAEQIKAINDQAMERNQQAERSRYVAQYQEGMAKVRSAANYQPFLNDQAWVDQKTGQRSNIGEHVFSTLYNSWASAEMDNARASGQQYNPPDPVALANLVHTWVRSVAEKLVNPGKQQAQQTQQVQAQRAQQQQRNAKMGGVAPMRAARGAAPAAGAKDAANSMRNKYLPANPGERAIFGS